MIEAVKIEYCDAQCAGGAYQNEIDMFPTRGPDIGYGFWVSVQWFSLKFPGESLIELHFPRQVYGLNVCS